MCMPLQNCIVLADDDQDHAYLFMRIMNQVAPDKEVIYVPNGMELLDLLQNMQPEYLFLDLNMPCKNGIECLQAIRENPFFKDVKVIVYTSSFKMNDISKCFDNKADFYIVKPYNTEHLTKALRTIFNHTKDTTPMSYHYFINDKFVPFTAQF